MPFENFTTLRNVGILLEEELARQAPIKDLLQLKEKLFELG